MWKEKGFNEDSVADNYAFLDTSVESPAAVKNACEAGLLCGNMAESVLGDPAKGN